MTQFCRVVRPLPVIFLRKNTKKFKFGPRSRIAAHPTLPKKVHPTMPKATTPTRGRHGRRHNPLEDDILATGLLKNKPSKGKKRDSGEDDDQQQFVESKASKQILRLGRELVEEDLQENATAPTGSSNSAFDPAFARRLDFEDEEEEGHAGGVFEDDTFGDDDEVPEEFGGEIEVDDLETFNKFLPSGDENPLSGWVTDDKVDNAEAQGSGTNLADLILAKIAEHEARGQGGAGGGAGGGMAPFEEDYELPPKVVEAFTKYAPLLSSTLEFQY